MGDAWFRLGGLLELFGADVAQRRVSRDSDIKHFNVVEETPTCFGMRLVVLVANEFPLQLGEKLVFGVKSQLRGSVDICHSRLPAGSWQRHNAISLHLLACLRVVVLVLVAFVVIPFVVGTTTATR